MKTYGLCTYPMLRCRFPDLDSLAWTINRKKIYVCNVMNHPKEKSFTDNEKNLILQKMGFEDNEKNRNMVFEDWKEGLGLA